MAREKALEICKNIKRTLDKEIKETCTKYSNPMFNKPIVKKSVLKKRLSELITQYKIKKEEL